MHHDQLHNQQATEPDKGPDHEIKVQWWTAEQTLEGPRGIYCYEGLVGVCVCVCVCACANAQPGIYFVYIWCLHCVNPVTIPVGQAIPTADWKGWS